MTERTSIHSFPHRSVWPQAPRLNLKGEKLSSNSNKFTWISRHSVSCPLQLLCSTPLLSVSSHCAWPGKNWPPELCGWIQKLSWSHTRPTSWQRHIVNYVRHSVLLIDSSQAQFSGHVCICEKVGRGRRLLDTRCEEYSGRSEWPRKDWERGGITRWRIGNPWEIFR